MRKEKFILLVVCLLSLSISSLWAVPADPRPRQVEQEDGSLVTVYQRGDERFHWVERADGCWMQCLENGLYRPMDEAEKVAMMAQGEAAITRATDAYNLKLNLAERGLVVLVEFPDAKFKPENTREAFDSLLMSDHYDYVNKGRADSYSTVITEYQATGSANQYFRDQSNGQYDPQFDVVGPVCMSRSYSYYGANSGGIERNIPDMIKEACEAVDNEVDFSRYDFNDDGYVDFVFFIYAGHGEHDMGNKTEYIWPHKFNYTRYGRSPLSVDGKLVDLYACSSELNNVGSRCGIGTFCHEFSHVCGLPDLYYTNGVGGPKTLGNWDIMDYGPYNNNGNTPPAYSAYERWFCGWMTPTLLNQRATCTLEPMYASNHAYLITETGTHNMDGFKPSPETFYLLENRQQSGWDKYLPGHGLLVTKVIYNPANWQSGVVNNNAKQMGVDIIEADGKSAASYNAKQGDAFPAGLHDYLDAVGYPDYDAADYEITEIQEKNGIITFLCNGGAAQWEVAVFEQELLSGDNIEIEAVYAVYDFATIMPLTETNLALLAPGQYIIRYTRNGVSKRKYHKHVILSE